MGTQNNQNGVFKYTVHIKNLLITHVSVIIILKNGIILPPGIIFSFWNSKIKKLY